MRRATRPSLLGGRPPAFGISPRGRSRHPLAELVMNPGAFNSPFRLG